MKNIYEHHHLPAVALCSGNLSFPKFALYTCGQAIWREAIREVHYPGSDIKDFISNQGVHPLPGYDDSISLSITESGESPAQGMHAPITFNSQSFNERYVLHGRKTNDIKDFLKEQLYQLLNSCRRHVLMGAEHASSLSMRQSLFRPNNYRDLSPKEYPSSTR